MKGDLTLLFSLDCDRELTHSRSSDLPKKSVKKLYPVRLLWNRALHRLVHEINQALMVIDHLTEEPMIRISSAIRSCCGKRLGL